MPLFYRIQPAGLGLDHTSESSNGPVDELHVFSMAAQVFHVDAGGPLWATRRIYGNEVVEIEAPASWDNGDVEGVAIDPAESRITRRWALEDFALVVAREVFDGLDSMTGEDAWEMCHAFVNPADCEVIS